MANRTNRVLVEHNPFSSQKKKSSLPSWDHTLCSARVNNHSDDRLQRNPLAMADMGKVESCKGQESLKGQEDRPARPSRVQTVVRFAGVLVLGAAIGAIVMFVADKPASTNNADGPNVTAGELLSVRQ